MNFRALAILGWIVCLTMAEARPIHPNILIVMADQWRAQAFGYAGDPNVHTPHLDALAAESANCRYAISSFPVCCPMRATLLTGQRALTHGVFMNDVPLGTNAISLAQAVHAVGYDTGFVGKWHVNGDGRSKFIPRERRQGFDYWKVLECTHNYNNSFYYSDTPEKLKWEGYDAIAQTKDTQQYLQSRATNNKPFLFILSWGPPHSPYGTAPPEYRAMYDAGKIIPRGNVSTNDNVQWRKDAAGYYAHCTALDDCMGEILRTLRETGLETNTIVLFTSDHGDMLGSHDMAAKQKPYEESIRVPLLVRGPGVARRALDGIITSADLMPTILGLCNASIPKMVEGKDFSSYLRGGRDPSENAALLWCIAPFSEFSRAKGGREFRGVRTERYTYVRDLSGPWLLFDDQSDPLQLTNLVNHSSAQEKLDRLLSKKLKQVHDDFRPASYYLEKWNWPTNAAGTVPYTN